MLYRLLGFLAGFAAVVAVCMFVGARTAHSRVLSESGGAIRTVEIQYTRVSSDVLWPCISDFLRQLDPSVEVIAACGDSDDAAEFLKRRSDIPQRRVETVIVGVPITGWSKDRFLVSDKTLLCPKEEASAVPSRTNDSLVAKALARQWPSRFRVLDTGLRFDSGDILCTQSQAIVNQEFLAKNPGVPNLLGELQRMTGLKPVVLNGTPGHHIGMFAAPLDDRTVVVGDPSIGQRLWPDSASARLGHPDTTPGDTQPFRNAIAQFMSAGYRVCRVPVIIIEPKVYVTYTNAVFDERDGKKIVFMPMYDVPRLDATAAEAFRSEGYEVRPVHVGNVFRLRGTIGCLVNVLERR